MEETAQTTSNINKRPNVNNPVYFGKSGCPSRKGVTHYTTTRKSVYLYFSR